MDLISRQAAIDAADRADYTGLEVEDVKKVTDEVVKELKQIPSAQPEPKWIPCSERLPKAGVRYQVTFESGEVGYADFRNKKFFGDGTVKEAVWETERYYEDDGEVIAWMPLPEPWKGEENG